MIVINLRTLCPFEQLCSVKPSAPSSSLAFGVQSLYKWHTMNQYCIAFSTCFILDEWFNVIFREVSLVSAATCVAILHRDVSAVTWAQFYQFTIDYLFMANIMCHLNVLFICHSIVSNKFFFIKNVSSYSQKWFICSQKLYQNTAAA